MERKPNLLRLLALLGVSLVLFATTTKAHITSQMQTDMVSLATNEITKQLVNGSDNKSANQSEQTRKSLIRLVQSGQILDYLGSSYKHSKFDVCKWLTQASVENTSAETIMYRAEAQRLFKCSGSFPESVAGDVKGVLSNPTVFLTSPGDVYAANIIFKRKKAYGSEAEGAQFKTQFHQALSANWISPFNPETFAFNDGPAGVTAGSIQFLEVLAEVSKELGEEAASKAQKAMQTLLNSASATSFDRDSENQIFFIAPRNAMNPQEFDLSMANFHFQNVLNALGQKSVNLSNMRNYFMGRAIAHSNVQSLYYSFRGLKSSYTAFFLSAVDGFASVHATESGKNVLKYDIVDFLGKPVSGAVLQKVSLKAAKSSEQSDVTAAAQVQGSQLIVTLEKITELSWASHTLVADLQIQNTPVNFRKVFNVQVDIVPQAEIVFSQTNDWNSPSSYDVTSFPQKMKPMNTNAFPIVHIQANAVLFGDKNKDQDYPQVVYVTLKKKGILPYSVHANYIASIKRHQISFDLRVLMPDQINGDYTIALHVEDPRAEKPFVVDMGILQINFNEGSQEATNSGIRPDFELLEKITNYFPPEEESKGGVLPLAFCGILVVLFLNYMGSLSSNKTNLNNLSFGGILFVLNYLLILGVIVAFWIEINLVNTLWILLALSPVTLWTMNSGLTPENCQVPEFKQAKASSDKKKK